MADVNIDINVAANQALKSLKNIEVQAKKTTKKVSDVGMSMVKINAAIAVGQQVYRAFAGAIGSVIDAATIQEDAINELNIALKSAGDSSEETSQKFQDFASQLQKTSKFGDEATIKAGALFLQLTKNTGAMESAVKAATNMSAALGMDLNNAVTLIAKTMSDTGISMLKRYAINVEKGKTPAENLANAIAKINSQFSGAAAGQINTFSGALQQSKNSFGDLLEEIGFFLTKNPLVLEGIKSSSKLFQELGASVKSFAEGFGPSLKKSEGEWATYTRKIDETEKAIEKLKSSESSIFDIFRNKDAKLKELTKDLESYREKQYMASIEVAQQSEKSANAVEDAEKKKLTVMDLYSTAAAESKAERDAIEVERETVQNDERLQRLADTLGEEEVMRALHDAKKLEAADQHAKAIERLNKLQSKAEKEELFRRRKFEDLSAKQKLANFQSTLGTIASMSTAHNKLLGGIGKASAVANATINTYKAANVALASAPPPFNFGLAALVTTAGLVNVAKIVGMQLGEGGIVQPQPGGVPAILAEKGQPEAVIPLDEAGSFGVTVNIYGDVLDEDSFIDRLVDKINDGVEFRNLQLKTA